MSAPSSNPNFLNEATYELRLRKQARKVRFFTVGFLSITVIIAIVFLLVTGKLLIGPILIAAAMACYAQFAPNRKIVKRGWPKPSFSCDKCGSQGWPEDLTPAQTCSVCDNDKFGGVISKAA